jgi:uncharacterized membrane protein YobD (UPF0266 family)
MAEAPISLLVIQLPLAVVWAFYWHWVLPMAVGKFTRSGKSKKKYRVKKIHFVQLLYLYILIK